MTMAKQRVTFHGLLEQLQDLVDQAGLHGQWRQEPHAWHFRRQDGAGMHWSSGTGTIWYDGPIGPREKLAARMAPVLARAAGVAAPAKLEAETAEEFEVVLRRRRGPDLLVLPVSDLAWALRVLEQVKDRSEPDVGSAARGPRRCRDRWWCGTNSE